MTTNAMLLDRYMDYLVENNFSLLISLDGDEEGQSYRVDHRGRNSFSTVIRNVFLLRDKYPEYFKKEFLLMLYYIIRIALKDCMIFKNNIGKLPMISELNNSGIREDKRNEFEKIFVSKQTDLYNSFNSEALIDEMFYDVADTKVYILIWRDLVIIFIKVMLIYYLINPNELFANRNLYSIFKENVFDY